VYLVQPRCVPPSLEVCTSSILIFITQRHVGLFNREVVVFIDYVGECGFHLYIISDQLNNHHREGSGNQPDKDLAFDTRASAHRFPTVSMGMMPLYQKLSFGLVALEGNNEKSEGQKIKTQGRETRNHLSDDWPRANVNS